MLRFIKLPDITINNQLKFKKTLKMSIKNSSYKLYASRRLRKILTVSKAQVLAHALLYAQLNYINVSNSSKTT